MNTKTKKGFTLTELIIVVVIIGILAAVLIPTLTACVKKAKISNDKQLVRNLNLALKNDEEYVISGDKHEHMQAALDAAFEAGYDVSKINATKYDNEILWDSVNDVFCYLNDGDIEYIPDSISGVGLGANDYRLWKISKTVDAKYSTYYIGEETTIDTSKGFDAPKNTNVTVINYTNSGSAQDVVIRTNGGTLTVDAENDTVQHYGEAQVVTLTAVGDHSYYERGSVNLVDVKKGRLVITNDAEAEVGTIYLTATNDAYDGIILATQSGSTLPEVVARESVSIPTTGEKLVVTIQTNVDANGENPTKTEEIKLYPASDVKEATNGYNVSDLGLLVVEAISSEAQTQAAGQITDAAVLESVKESNVSTKENVTAAATMFAGGKGTKEKPYLINNSWHWNNMYVALADANSKLYFQLTNDVHFDDEQILFAKSWDYNSELDLNGNNHTVYAKNFEDDGYGYSVLFAYLYNSSIYDINFDYLITSTGCSGLCYSAEGTCTFRNITTSGSIRANGWVASTFVMYPYPLTTDYTSTFIKYINCSNTCDISGSASYAAPFGGHCNTNKINVSFENCTNYGDISGQYASGFVGMVNGNYITFEGDNAALNYGTILGTSKAGNFTYEDPDKNGVYTTTFKANYNNANKTCTVAAGSSSIGKYQTFTINDPGFNNNIAFNTQSGATYYEVEFSTSVGNYGYGSVGEVWGGGFPRTVTLKYTNDDAVDGVITTDFKKLYIAEANNTKHHCLTNNEVEYNGLYVSENYVLSENDITFGTYGDLIVIAKHDGKEFYFINNNGYYGLLTSAEQADNNKTKTISIYVTAYTSEGGKLISSSTYSYTFKISDAVNYFGN